MVEINAVFVREPPSHGGSRRFKSSTAYQAKIKGILQNKIPAFFGTFGTMLYQSSTLTLAGKSAHSPGRSRTKHKAAPQA